MNNTYSNTNNNIITLIQLIILKMEDYHCEICDKHIDIESKSKHLN